MNQSLEVAMSNAISQLLGVMPAIPANSENPAVALGLEIIFFAIVAFTLAISLGGVVGGLWLVIQQWREDIHPRRLRRRAGAKPV
jgi:hypothetical protein